jgi:hypothetical protein
VEDEELEVLALGVLEEVSHSLGGLALATTDGHVVALGQLGSLQFAELALLLYVEDLVEGVFRELVCGNLTGAEADRVAGVRLV